MSSRSLPGNTPSLKHHKHTNQAYVLLDGRRHYLGKFGLPETDRAYHRLIAEWITAGYRLPVPEEKITVLEVADAYTDYARQYYVDKDGKPSEQNARIRAAFIDLLALYGDVPAVTFGPKALRAVRQVWIDRGIAISTMNGYDSTIKHMFKWAVAHEMIPVETHTHPGLSISRQCALLDVSRSSVYYTPNTSESLENLALMGLIDEEYTRHPFFGVPKITHWLNEQGYGVNHKRVARLSPLWVVDAVGRISLDFPANTGPVTAKLKSYLRIGIACGQVGAYFAALS